MNKSYLAISAVVSVAFVALSVLPVSAATSGTFRGRFAGMHASSTAAMRDPATMKSRADAQISARITALQTLAARIDQMIKVDPSEKTELESMIQSSIQDMTTLQAKIDADTDAATMRTDMQSIAKDYRIYLLVLPQGRIIAASDRVRTIVGLMQDLGTKLQDRIASAQTAGQDVSALNTSLSDLNAKIGDANTQAQTAISSVANLKPDNGDASVLASNQTALKGARDNIKAAIVDLTTARQDAGSIVTALRSMNASASGSTSSTTSQ